MSRNEKRRDLIFKIENYGKFNIKTTRIVEEFRNKSYITYSI